MDELLPVETTTPESIFIEHSEKNAIRLALEELPLHLREILLLCEVEEMSYQEISEALTIPIGTVMSRLFRARKALLDCCNRAPTRI